MPKDRLTAIVAFEIDALSAYYMDGKGERFFVASLSGPRPLMVRVLPDLYEPALVALGDQVMILRGFERLGEGDAACAVVQEWRCEVLPT
jgi:hypothetical protein